MASLVLFLLLLGAPPAATPASGTTATSAVPAGESRTIVGEIVWVDLPARLVLIRESVKTTRVKGQPPARQTVAVGVSTDVTITRGRTAVSLESLKAKDHVTARYLRTSEGAKALTFRVADASPAAAAGDGSSPAGGN
ncbi:MAG: hypothetical protein WCC53_04535 [Thermoanaerobaculia bacterium]